MSRDEHGMPLPEDRLLPITWNKNRDPVDLNGTMLETNIDVEYFVHAANWIIPCREIVRRLAEWWEDKEHSIGSLGIEASKLWAEMQREAKRGGE